MLPTSARSITILNGLLLLLACAAGAIDAISYLGLGRVFTANMTGNTVLLSLAPESAVLFPLALMLIVMVTAAVHWQQ